MCKVLNYDNISCDFDSLTGTLTAEAFRREVEKLFSKSRNNALILLDLDSFGRLNDSLGRSGADDILISVVRTVKEALRKNDLMGRMGGDEFFVCISDIGQLSNVERIARQICTQARHSLPNGGFLSASVGISVSGVDGDDFEVLYDKAKKAMKCAKNKGGNGYVIYDDALINDCDCVKRAGAEAARGVRSGENNILVTYRLSDGQFVYPESNSLFCESRGDVPLWDIFEKEGVSSRNTAMLIKEEIENLKKSKTPTVHFADYYLRCREQLWHWYRVGFIYAVGDVATVTFTDINDEIVTNKNLVKMAEYDELTGLMNRSAFCRTVDNVYDYDSDGMKNGRYSIIYFDISRFKAINDMFGMDEGDRLLKFIADVVIDGMRNNDCSCRIGSDRFILFVNNREVTPEYVVSYLYDEISRYDLPFEITFNAGIFITNEEHLSCEAMIDRAILAQSSVKGSYTVRAARFTEELRKDMLGEQEIVGMMRNALSSKQFVVYYQPQYNHSTGMLTGTEALVRWNHPERGLISPGVFIPIFEKNGFITNLDLYVFERVCEFLSKAIEKSYTIVPISTNFSRYDIFLPDFVDRLEAIREKYGVPVKYLRVELTESAIFGSSQHANEVIGKLHSCGYVVEMDDFGSGYSSLNVLKDIELDTIKLDMQFLREETESGKGGMILSSVVRMAKWLSIPVIAEGVETVLQADFLRSIGCDYIQGFLYSKPLPEEEYEKIISASLIGATVPQMNLIDTLNACNFWNPKSQETLIFSNYVGGACLFEFNGESIEVLRVNKKYLQELCMNLSERDMIEGDPTRFLDPLNKKIYFDMLHRAIETGDEQECDTLRRIQSECCGEELFNIRTNVRMVGKSDDCYLFYATIRNVTSEKNYIDSLMHNDLGFRTVSEQVNIYFWEYNIITKDMKPCFRCMRDLGLPPLVKNYPEPLIEKGIIPQQYAQEYRDWLKNLENGVESMEADFALTPDLIPFKFRYTTEFDENGHPVKAYASATLIRE